MLRSFLAPARLLFIAFLLLAGRAAGDEARFTILHTNDLHSCFEGLGPDRYFTPAVGDADPVAGHYARLAWLIKTIRAERAAAGEPVLLLDSGDADYGTLFHIITPSASSPLAPEWQFFQQTGYDAMAMGNHTFEGTENGLRTAFAKAASLGLTLPLLASNLRFQAGSEAFQALRHDHLAPASSTRLTRFFLRDLPSASGSIRVGLIGLVGPNAARLCLANRQTLGFVGFDDTTAKPEPAALHELVRELVAELRGAYHADLVVALFHGGTPEDEELAAAVPDLDLILAGHTHEPYLKKVGKTIIAQTGWGGARLGCLDLVWASQTLGLRNEGMTLRQVDDAVPADPDTLAFIDRCKREIDRLLQPGPFTYAMAVCELAGDIPKARWPNNQAGVFVATRLREEINRRLARPIDCYLSTFGLIRSEFRAVSKNPTLYQYSDIFKFSPLGIDPAGRAGAPVVTFFLTRGEVKTLLEAMTVFAGQTPSYEAVLSDSVSWSLRWWGVPFSSRISDLRLGGSELLASTTLVHVAANEFFARNLKRIGVLTHGMAVVEPRDASGTPIASFPASGLPSEAELLAAGLAHFASGTSR